MGISPVSIGRLFQSMMPDRGRAERPDSAPSPFKTLGEAGSESAPHSLADLKDGGSSFRFSSLEISVQYHMERQVLDKSGNVIGRESLDFSMEYQRIELEGNFREAREAGGKEGGPKIPEAVQKLLEHFSPENTAQRIANFVTGGFGKTSFGESPSPEARRGFADFILPYVREGVDSALAMFGELPDEIRQNAEETFTRVKDLLDQFADGPQEA